MALYHPLNHYLQAAAKRGETAITLTLDEIETILGFPLSHVARQNPDWWQADTHSHHAWTRSWQKAGWALEKLETSPINDEQKEKDRFFKEFQEIMTEIEDLLKPHLDLRVKKRGLPFKPPPPQNQC